MCLCTSVVSNNFAWIVDMECVCAPLLSAEIWTMDLECVCCQHKCCLDHGFGNILMLTWMMQSTPTLNFGC